MACLSEAAKELEIRIVTHIILFVLAFFLFYVGLAVGLAYNATLGSVLWIMGGLTIVGNIAWIVMHSRRRWRRR